MTLYRFAADVWGQWRGFDRRRIRRRVCANACLSADELAREARALFRRRVELAVACFPGYAEHLRRHGARVEAGRELSPEDLPIWTRADQRAFFESLRGPPIPGAFVHGTGGSTGVPLRFYVTRESYEWRTAVSDRGYAWAGAEEGQRSFYVWGTPIRPPSPAQRAKAGLHHALQRRAYFDSFRFGDVEKRRCCEQINRLRPPVIVGYAGNLIELACFARDNPGVLAWRAARLVTAAEGLAPGRRELIESQLGGKVFLSYGSREFMLIGMECPRHEGYHLASDNLLVDVVREDGRPAAEGETGRILITDLHNTANPFIRYEIGDAGALAPAGQRCACGLPFPLLLRVDGRLQEVILTPDGGRVTALYIPHLMKEFAWVDGYQLVQPSPAEVVVHLVTREELTAARTAPIEAALRGVTGPSLRLSFRRVAGLERTASGKTPIVSTPAAGPLLTNQQETDIHTRNE